MGAWCCEHYSVGCPTTPPPMMPNDTPRPTTSPCPFDCNAGYNELGPLQWVKGWSGAKKLYCCSTAAQTSTKDANQTHHPKRRGLSNYLCLPANMHGWQERRPSLAPSSRCMCLLILDKFCIELPSCGFAYAKK